MKTSTFVLPCVLAIVLVGNAFPQSVDHEAEILAMQPDAVKISEGVYAAVDGRRHTIHTFGVSGLKYMIEEVESKLTRPLFPISDPHGYSALLEMYDALTRQLERTKSSKTRGDGGAVSLQAQDSGSLCQNSNSYTLEAFAGAEWLYSTEAYAHAAFQQRGVGPAVEGDGTLIAYAEASAFGVPTSDHDSTTMPLQGLLGWIEAGPVSAVSGFGNAECVTAYAAATFSATCGSGEFRSVSESYDNWCD